MSLMDSIKKKIKEKQEENRIYNEAYREARKDQLKIQAKETAIAERKVAVKKAKIRAEQGPLAMIFGTSKSKPAHAKRPQAKANSKFIIKGGVAYPVAPVKKKKRKKKPRRSQSNGLLEAVEEIL